MKGIPMSPEAPERALKLLKQKGRSKRALYRMYKKGTALHALMKGTQFSIMPETAKRLAEILELDLEAFLTGNYEIEDEIDDHDALSEQDQEELDAGYSRLATFKRWIETGY